MKPVIIASIHWINTCTTTYWLLIQWTFHRTSYSVSWPWWGAAWQSSSPGERSETGCLLMWSPNGNIMDNISEDVKRLDELWNSGRTYLKICPKHQLRQGMTMSQNFPCDSAPVPPASSANRQIQLDFLKIFSYIFFFWCVLRREFSGMIHWLTFNHPSNPSIPIHSLRLAPVSIFSTFLLSSLTFNRRSPVVRRPHGRWGHTSTSDGAWPREDCKEGHRHRIISRVEME